jgi:uncharacterized protein YggE
LRARSRLQVLVFIRDIVPLRKMMGFEAFYQLAVPMTDLAKIGEVVYKAVLVGANVVNVDPFTSHEEDLKESRKIGLRRALADVKSKAEIIAGGLGS